MNYTNELMKIAGVPKALSVIAKAKEASRVKVPLKIGDNINQVLPDRLLKRGLVSDEALSRVRSNQRGKEIAKMAPGEERDTAIAYAKSNKRVGDALRDRDFEKYRIPTTGADKNLKDTSRASEIGNGEQLSKTRRGMRAIDNASAEYKKVFNGSKAEMVPQKNHWNQEGLAEYDKANPEHAFVTKGDVEEFNANKAATPKKTNPEPAATPKKPNPEPVAKGEGFTMADSNAPKGATPKTEKSPGQIERERRQAAQPKQEQQQTPPPNNNQQTPPPNNNQQTPPPNNNQQTPPPQGSTPPPQGATPKTDNVPATVPEATPDPKKNEVATSNGMKLTWPGVAAGAAAIGAGGYLAGNAMNQ